MKTIANKLKKRFIIFIGYFVLGTLGGWFAYDFMIFFLQTENIEFIYTSLSELYFLRLKVMVLFGFMIAAIYFGTSTPETINKLNRFSIITIPSFLICGIVLAGLKILIVGNLEMHDFGVHPALSATSLRIELVPFSGMFMAILMNVYLSKRTARKI